MHNTYQSQIEYSASHSRGRSGSPEESILKNNRWGYVTKNLLGLVSCTFPELNYKKYQSSLIAYIAAGNIKSKIIVTKKSVIDRALSVVHQFESREFYEQYKTLIQGLSMSVLLNEFNNRDGNRTKNCFLS